MRQVWTKCSTVMAVALILCGCSTTKDQLLTHDNRTMLDIWNSDSPRRSAITTQDIAHSGLARKRTTSAGPAQISYTRTAHNEILSQFHRLPNPDLVMFVFPHLSGTEPVPIPGYSTVFPLYQKVQYALPGERLEDY